MHYIKKSNNQEEYMRIKAVIIIMLIFLFIAIGNNNVNAQTYSYMEKLSSDLTKIQFDSWANNMKGRTVTWKGKVIDVVKKRPSYEVYIDMHDSGGSDVPFETQSGRGATFRFNVPSGKGADVSFEVSPNVGGGLSARQPISFTGQIVSLDVVSGKLQIKLKNVKIN
jgi:hypothetical protein